VIILDHLGLLLVETLFAKRLRHIWIDLGFTEFAENFLGGHGAKIEICNVKAR